MIILHEKQYDVDVLLYWYLVFLAESGAKHQQSINQTIIVSMRNKRVDSAYRFEFEFWSSYNYFVIWELCSSL
jgi:hypothetical protein